MKLKKPELILTLLGGLFSAMSFSQVMLSNAPKPWTFQVITPNHYLPESTIPIPATSNIIDFGQERIHQQNQRMIEESLPREALQRQQHQIYRDIAELNSTNYSLPSHVGKQGASNYYDAFHQLNQLDFNNFSVRDLTFLIEDTYFENKLDKAEFDKIISNIGTFLKAIIKERGYDQNSNSVKNFVIFQFFSEQLSLKNGTKHLPFQYDFDDYLGRQDYSKMFVTKLLKTQAGQCHSMPLLYLIVVEEIGAEAYLAFSPNHSYIRFLADNGKWYNIELTNGMFSSSSFILQSGFIKSEALLNKIYMQNLTEKELMAQFYTDLANGYIAKFGYDDFVGNVISKALELYPNGIGANLIKANLLTIGFEYVCQQLGINPRNKVDLQNIRHYPNIVKLLNTVNGQYTAVDNLGYTNMPPEAYQDWLQSMKEQKNIQENERINEQFKNLFKQKIIKD